MFKSLLKFMNYWYFRYLLITELYMVEKWERVMIHMVFFAILSIISAFNIFVILGLVSHFTQTDYSALEKQTLTNSGLHQGSIFNYEL